MGRKDTHPMDIICGKMVNEKEHFHGPEWDMCSGISKIRLETIRMSG